MNSSCIILVYYMCARSKSGFESTQALKSVFWRQIWVFHTYDILKLYNVNLECDVTFCQIFIACCRKRISFFTPGYKVTWKGFDEDFISSNLKREYTINMNMLKAFRVQGLWLYCGHVQLPSNSTRTFDRSIGLGIVSSNHQFQITKPGGQTLHTMYKLM